MLMNCLKCNKVCDVKKGRKYCSFDCYRLSNIGKIGVRFGWKLSPEIRKKISDRMKIDSKKPRVCRLSREAIDKRNIKISLSNKGKNLGRKLSEETKKKISASTIKLAKHNQITTKTSDRQWLDSNYKYWAITVKRRDNYKCKMSDDKCNGRLDSHHIYNWMDYPELRYDINNGITVCFYHHPKGREQEEKMIPIFEKLIAYNSI